MDNFDLRKYLAENAFQGSFSDKAQAAYDEDELDKQSKHMEDNPQAKQAGYTYEQEETVEEGLEDYKKIRTGAHTKQAFELIINKKSGLHASPMRLKDGILVHHRDLEDAMKILDRKMIPYKTSQVTAVKEDYNTGPDMNVLKQLGVDKAIEGIVGNMIQAIKSGKVEEESFSTTDKLVKTLADMFETAIEKHQDKLQDQGGIAETEVEEQFGGETTGAAAAGLDVIIDKLKHMASKSGATAAKAKAALEDLAKGAAYAMKREEVEEGEKVSREEQLKAEIAAMFSEEVDNEWYDKMINNPEKPLHERIYYFVLKAQANKENGLPYSLTGLFSKAEEHPEYENLTSSEDTKLNNMLRQEYLSNYDE